MKAGIKEKCASELLFEAGQEKGFLCGAGGVGRSEGASRKKKEEEGVDKSLPSRPPHKGGRVVFWALADKRVQFLSLGRNENFGRKRIFFLVALNRWSRGKTRFIWKEKHFSLLNLKHLLPQKNFKTNFIFSHILGQRKVNRKKTRKLCQ